MSDLAPFVAAVLRDKSIADMKDENDALRRQLGDIRAVKITGPNGSPVYARAQLEDGHLSGEVLDKYVVPFPKVLFPFPKPIRELPIDEDRQQQQDEPEYPRCSPRDLRHLEVRIGGFGHIGTVNGRFQRVYYNQDTRFGLWFCIPVQRSTVHVLLEVSFLIGPFSSRAEFEEFNPSSDNATILQDERYQALNIYFWMADLDTDAISGLIDNFEQRRRRAEDAIADHYEAAYYAAQEEEDLPANDDNNDV